MSTTRVWTVASMALLLAVGSDAGDDGQGLTVSVMSFNLRYATENDADNQWARRKELVFDTLRAAAPDVIGLQEALRSQLDDLRRALPEYGEVGVGRDGGQKGEYSAILYRTERFAADEAESGTFWLSDTPEKPSVHWGNACIRICTWARLTDRSTHESFYLYNTHLDHKSGPSREKSIRLIVARILSRKQPDPVVLTGDFNAGESDPTVLYVKGAGAGDDRTPLTLVDSFRVLYPDEKEAGTFNGFAGRSDGAKIDYVLVSPDTQVLAAAIMREQKDGRYPSDHFPVTARLRFPR